MKHLVRRVKPSPKSDAELQRVVAALQRSLVVHFRSEEKDQFGAIRRMVRDPTLGPRHARVLHELRDGALSVSEIAARLEVEISTASQLAGELRRAGLTSASRDPSDARRVLVSAKPNVLRDVVAFFGRRIHPMRAALASLDTRERAAFVKGLRAWVAALDASSSAVSSDDGID